MKIQRPATPEQRITLAPHVARVQEAKRELHEALYALQTAVRTIESRPGSLDVDSMIWTLEVADPPAAREGPTGSVPINRLNGKGANG